MLLTFDSVGDCNINGNVDVDNDDVDNGDDTEDDGSDDDDDNRDDINDNDDHYKEAVNGSLISCVCNGRC